MWEEQFQPKGWSKKLSVNTKSPISCMILNQQENRIFLGNKYGFIQAWYIDYEKKSIGITHEMRKIHQNCIYDISLNTSENRLITCSEDKKIILWSINYNAPERKIL